MEENKEIKPIPEETKEKMVEVLREFAKIGVIGKACERCGLTRRTHTTWLAEYPEYKERYEDVKETFVDGLEVVAIERAKEKSDSLLAMMLKSHRREVYGDTSNVNLNSNQGKIQLVFAEGMLTEEEKNLLRGDANEEMQA